MEHHRGMLVDAVRMRSKGRKLPNAVVMATPPTRGRLWLTNFRPAKDNSTTPLMAALLVGEQSPWPVLDQAEVRCIKDGQMVIVGIEDLGDGPKRSRLFRQAWWCRVVTEVPEPVPTH